MRYHSIAKYQNIDCIVINEAELRHELRERNKDLDILMNDFSDQIGANLLAVTQGSSGVKLNIQDTKEVIHCPAFASTIVLEKMLMKSVVGYGSVSYTHLTLPTKA